MNRQNFLTGRHLIWAALAPILIVCGGDVTTPGGGGENQDPRQCATRFNSAWTNRSLQVTVDQPPCPFTVSANYFDQVDYVAMVRAPRSSITFDPYGRPESYVSGTVWDLYNLSTIANAPFVYFTRDPNDTSIYRSEVRTSGYPGAPQHRNPQNPTQLLDSLALDVWFMTGLPKAGKILPGNLTDLPQTVLGTDALVAGTYSTWRSKPDWDTTGYTYRWLIDGQPVPYVKSATLAKTFSTAGTFELANITIRADNTADTVRRMIQVLIQTGMTGPNQLKAYVEQGRWDAIVGGGVSPYTFEWYADGTLVGTGNYYEGSFGPGGSVHRLELFATDSQGNRNSSVIEVYAQYPDCPDCPPSKPGTVVKEK